MIDLPGLPPSKPSAAIFAVLASSWINISSGQQGPSSPWMGLRRRFVLRVVLGSALGEKSGCFSRDRRDEPSWWGCPLSMVQDLSRIHGTTGGGWPCCEPLQVACLHARLAAKGSSPEGVASPWSAVDPVRAGGRLVAFLPGIRGEFQYPLTLPVQKPTMLAACSSMGRRPALAQSKGPIASSRPVVAPSTSPRLPASACPACRPRAPAAERAASAAARRPETWRCRTPRPGPVPGSGGPPPVAR